MKKILKSLLIISLLFSIGCNDNDDPNWKEGLKDFIQKAEVTNMEGITAEVDNQAKTITINGLKKNDELDQVLIKLTLADFVYMIAPTQLENKYNLSQEPTITIRYGALGKLNEKYQLIANLTEVEDIDPTSKGWVKSNDFGILPEGMTVYLSPDQLVSKKVKAAIVVANMSTKMKMQILGGEASGLKTPTEFYEESRAIVIINAAYFYQTSNVGMLVKDGKVIRNSNSDEVKRKGPDGTDVSYYPARGVFNMTAGNRYQVNWMYNVEGLITAYDIPSPIQLGNEPPVKPTAEFPQAAKNINLHMAIGAGPVLLKEGEIKNTWEQEIWDDLGGIQPTKANPRTAVAVTKGGKLLYFVCEGRNATEGVAGLTTEEVAQILKDLGCVDALNLDGGGSTCMLINGEEAIKTSNTNGAQRAVATALAIK